MDRRKQTRGISFCTLEASNMDEDPNNLDLSYVLNSHMLRSSTCTLLYCVHVVTLFPIRNQIIPHITDISPFTELLTTLLASCCISLTPVHSQLSAAREKNLVGRIVLAHVKTGGGGHDYCITVFLLYLLSYSERVKHVFVFHVSSISNSPLNFQPAHCVARSQNQIIECQFSVRIPI